MLTVCYCYTGRPQSVNTHDCRSGPKRRHLGPRCKHLFWAPIFVCIFTWYTFLSRGIIVFVSVFSMTPSYVRTFYLSHLLISKIARSFWERDLGHETQSNNITAKFK